jgi:hypothetical protein
MKTNQNEAPNSAPSYTSCSGKIRACVWESQEANGIRHKILISRFFKKTIHGNGAGRFTLMN